MSLVAQAKLLRVLEERRFERLGGQQVDLGRLPSDLRRPTGRWSSSSATAGSAKTCITASTPSRSACPRCTNVAADIPVLAERFLARYCAANGLPLDSQGVLATRPSSC